MKNLKLQNQSLIIKWLWKFGTRNNMLWKEVICAKYGMEDNWITNMVNIPYSCAFWRAIMNLCPMMKAQIMYKVGNGLKVSFWNDNWLGQSTLK
ncbi:unnamed protein product [Withania somnifera]